jgi:hypothetical protein
MSLQRYALVAEIIGGVALVIGLLFVALELRQNTTAQRVTATQTLVVDYENAIDNLADADNACIYVLGINGLQNLSGIERYRFFVLWFHIFRAAEQLHYYSLEGMIEPQIWRGFQRQLNEVSRLPGVREYWNIRRDWFSDDFQAFIDDLVADGAPVEPELFSMEGCR